MNRWRKNHLEKAKEKNKFYSKLYGKKYRENYYNKNGKRLIKERIDLRIEVINYYGGKCECCGENDYRFLNFDHINNDGSKERREIGYSNFAKWLKINNYPKNIRILCFNCNMGRQFYGGENKICPHKLKVID